MQHNRTEFYVSLYLIMETGKIHIKNMVCPRCIMSVREIFRKNGIEPADVNLGTVTLDTEAQDKLASDDALIRKIKRSLEELGFEMIDDKRMQIVERIRTGVIEYVHNPENQDKAKLSEYLQRKCLKEYSALSKLFTEIKGMTIEKYCILQKVEFVKELLFYGELSVSEIADMLHYSSVAHLSAQFKSVTGISPTRFRQMKDKPLTSIDSF